MRRIALIGLLVCVGCKSKEAGGVPILKVDAEHLQMQHAGAKPVDYQLPPGNGVILDATGYEFPIPAALNLTAPDTVQIVIGKGQMYTAEWKPVDGKQLLDATTLTPVAHAPPFTGYPAGSTIAIGIGHAVKTDGPKQQFQVIWVGMAQVK